MKWQVGPVRIHHAAVSPAVHPTVSFVVVFELHEFGLSKGHSYKHTQEKSFQHFTPSNYEHDEYHF